MTSDGTMERAGDHPVLEALARGGLIAYGVVHLLICWLALQLAWGAAGRNADPSGAMRTLAEQPMGEAALWAVGLGLASLTLWQLSEAIWLSHVGSLPRPVVRIAKGGKALVYAALGANALAFALGWQISTSRSQQQTTSGVLGWPGGQVIVTVAGLVVIGIGLVMVVRGVRQDFTDDWDLSSLDVTARSVIVRMGQFGHLAKGLAVGLVGGLLAYAAVTFDPKEARGLDGAMHVIVQQPYGRALLTAVALGFFTFGVLTMLQVRFRRM